MTNEMDVLNLDERQRHCWLLANRVTLMIVGAVWIAMTAWRWAHDGLPVFLLAMIPVFALIRLLTYKFYTTRR